MNSDVYLRMRHPYADSNVIQTSEFYKFTATRSENQIGSLVLELPFSIDLFNFFEWDTIIEIWRSVNGEEFYLEMQTIWLVQKISAKLREDGFWVIVVEATDTIQLIDRRIVASFASTEESEKQLNAIAFILEVTAEAVAGDRAIYAMTIETRTGTGDLVTKEVSFQNLLSVLQDVVKIAETKNQYLVFDIVADGEGALVFRVFDEYRGDDHRSTAERPFIFSPERDNVTDLAFIKDFSKARSVAIIGGEGEGEDRRVGNGLNQALIDLSPWGHSELFVNASNSEDDEAIFDIARKELRNNTAKIYLSARLLETEELRYGGRAGFSYGDFVSILVLNGMYDVHIRAVTLSRENGIETLDVRAETEKDLFDLSFAMEDVPEHTEVTTFPPCNTQAQGTKIVVNGEEWELYYSNDYQNSKYWRSLRDFTATFSNSNMDQIYAAGGPYPPAAFSKYFINPFIGDASDHYWVTAATCSISHRPQNGAVKGYTIISAMSNVPFNTYIGLDGVSYGGFYNAEYSQNLPKLISNTALAFQADPYGTDPGPATVSVSITYKKMYRCYFENNN